jgi:hypothetical protein
MLSTLFPRSCCSDLHIIRSVGASVSGSVALLVPVLAGHQLCISTAFQKPRKSKDDNFERLAFATLAGLAPQ